MSNGTASNGHNGIDLGDGTRLFDGRYGVKTAAKRGDYLILETGIYQLRGTTGDKALGGLWRIGDHAMVDYDQLAAEAVTE